MLVISYWRLRVSMGKKSYAATYVRCMSEFPVKVSSFDPCCGIGSAHLPSWKCSLLGQEAVHEGTFLSPFLIYLDDVGKYGFQCYGVVGEYETSFKMTWAWR